MTRIPRPGDALPLQPQDPNRLKRKSEVGGTGAAKKAAPEAAPATAPAAAAAPAPASPAPAPAAAAAAAAAVPAEELEAWRAAAAEAGWTGVADALRHKLAFPARVDPKAKMAALVAHVQRLRAAGWAALDAGQRAGAEAEALAATLAAACAGAAADAEAAAGALGTAEARAGAAEGALAAATAEVGALRAAAAAAEAALAAAHEAEARLGADLAREAAGGAAAGARAEAETKRADEAQKYSLQLQEHSVALQTDLAAALAARAAASAEVATLAEEAAAQRGKAAALGDALEALQAAAAGSEAARSAALEDATRLRGELALTVAARDAALADARRAATAGDEARRDLERFRAATGAELAELEADKARGAATGARVAASVALAAALEEQLAAARAERAAAQAGWDSAAAAAAAARAEAARLAAALAEAERRVGEGEALRRRLHESVLQLKGNVRVFARLRPGAPGEPPALAPAPGADAARALDLVSERGPQRFSFDRVFGPAASQAEVFAEVAPLVQSALDGYRVCVFAYGQTSSGKTHTMLGEGPPGGAAEGLIPRAVHALFEWAAAAAEGGWRYAMRAAMVEVYNEELRDLVGPGPPPGKKHAISADDDSGAGVSASFLEWTDVATASDAGTLLSRAQRARAVGATAANDRSSRSHLVFVLGVEGFNAATGQTLKGGLNLVDLAGSERLKVSGAEGERLKETQAINKSLAALGDVIAALGARAEHVPYRNSKLTHLLAPALSGAGKALMLTALAPGAAAAAESLATLRFATKVNATEIGTARRIVAK